MNNTAFLYAIGPNASHANAKIGKNCFLSPQVTIGGRSGLEGAPVLEDGVVVGSGAKILGPIRIGAGALAGIAQVELLSALSSLQANDVVNFSLELLPAVLETTRGKGAGTFATGGYQGLARRGAIHQAGEVCLCFVDVHLHGLSLA